MAELGKFDAALQMIYLDYVEDRDHGARAGAELHPYVRGDRPLSLLMQFVGDLALIEQLGFETIWKEDGLARGHIRMRELETIARHPNVIRLAYGSEPNLDLDTSIPEIRADKVWTLNRASGVLTGAPPNGATGKGVVIGIIDSGIDVNHPDFFRTTGPNKTRILRIWDQGLEPVASEKSPNVSLLKGTTTYGVEYDDTAIDKHLGGGTPVRHKDCHGHGTFIASVAAGNGRASELPLRYVGVAPEADLVIVKATFLAKDPIVKFPLVTFGVRFEDAVTYILKVARDRLDGKPVVINYSSSVTTGPHDGSEPMEDFLSKQFAGKSGRAMVLSAGNSRDKRLHATIDKPAAQQVDVPFELKDERTVTVDFDTCSEKSNTKRLDLEIWYPDISGIEVRLLLPRQSQFSPPVSRPGQLSAPFDGRKKFLLTHVRVPLNSHTAFPFNRSMIQLHVTADGDTHAEGTYIIRIQGPPAVPVMHAWGTSYGPAGSRQILALAALLPVGVKIDDRHQLGTPAGAPNCITVASYDDVLGTLASNSAPGPLVDYGHGVLTQSKPDLAAPGVKIRAALSADCLYGLSAWLSLALGGLPYNELSGSSFAAPHVAGAIALMLQKNKNLTVAKILNILTTTGQGVRGVLPAAPNDFGAGKLDVKGAFDKA